MTELVGLEGSNLTERCYDCCEFKSRPVMAKLVLDLHEIFNKGWKIDQALNDIIEEAVEKRIPIVEIIPGKGSGQLKKKVIRFLQQKHIKAKYHRLDKDSKNFGRLFVRFKH
ncbi:MAG: DNA-nicking Smr family endonuclease [Bacteroidia bacterium]|jgi:DNA-nicking Smr family endonuclease